MTIARAVVVCALVCSGSDVSRAQPSVKEVATLATPAIATMVGFAKSGRLAAAVCRDRQLRVWSLPEGKPIRAIALGERSVDVMTVSADGRSIAIGDHAGEYSVWDASTGAEQLHLTMPFYPMALAFSADGQRLAIAPVGEPVQVYSMTSRARLLMLQRTTGGTTAVVFSADGNRIAVADADTVVRIYDAHTGELEVTNADFLLEPLAAAFSPDGRQLLTGGGDKIVSVVDVASGKSIRKTSRLDDPVISLDVSADGMFVATMLMHADNLLMPAPIIVSETASGRRVAQWLPTSLALGGGWTSDGRLLVATATEEAVHIWRVH